MDKAYSLGDDVKTYFDGYHKKYRLEGILVLEDFDAVYFQVFDNGKLVFVNSKYFKELSAIELAKWRIGNV